MKIEEKIEKYLNESYSKRDMMKDAEKVKEWYKSVKQTNKNYKIFQDMMTYIDLKYKKGKDPEIEPKDLQSGDIVNQLNGEPISNRAIKIMAKLGIN